MYDSKSSTGIFGPVVRFREGKFMLLGAITVDFDHVKPCFTWYELFQQLQMAEAEELTGTHCSLVPAVSPHILCDQLSDMDISKS